jgi:hypothetical protein
MHTRKFSHVVSNGTSNDKDSICLLSKNIENLTLNLGYMQKDIIKSVGDELNQFMKNQETSLKLKFEEFSKHQENELKKKFDEFNNQINDRFKKCFSVIEDFKTRQIYVQIDLIKVINPNVKWSEKQIQTFIASVKQHTAIKLNFNDIKSYVDKICV